MHIEQDVSENVMKHLFGEKDSLDTRRDMMQADKMHHLHLELGRSGNYLKPRTPYLFSESEKVGFLNLVSSTRVLGG